MLGIENANFIESARAEVLQQYVEWFDRKMMEENTGANDLIEAGKIRDEALDKQFKRDIRWLYDKLTGANDGLGKAKR